MVDYPSRIGPATSLIGRATRSATRSTIRLSGLLKGKGDESTTVIHPPDGGDSAVGFYLGNGSEAGKLRLSCKGRRRGGRGGRRGGGIRTRRRNQVRGKAAGAHLRLGAALQMRKLKPKKGEKGSMEVETPIYQLPDLLGPEMRRMAYYTQMISDHEGRPPAEGEREEEQEARRADNKKRKEVFEATEARRVGEFLKNQVENHRQDADWPALVDILRLKPDGACGVKRYLKGVPERLGQALELEVRCRKSFEKAHYTAISVFSPRGGFERLRRAPILQGVELMGVGDCGGGKEATLYRGNCILPQAEAEVRLTDIEARVTEFLELEKERLRSPVVGPFVMVVHYILIPKKAPLQLSNLRDGRLDSMFTAWIKERSRGLELYGLL